MQRAGRDGRKAGVVGTEYESGPVAGVIVAKWAVADLTAGLVPRLACVMSVAVTSRTTAKCHGWSSHNPPPSLSGGFGFRGLPRDLLDRGQQDRPDKLRIAPEMLGHFRGLEPEGIVSGQNQ